MQSVHHNKKHAGPLSESFLGDIPEDPEESLENIIANKIAPSGEDCLLMVGDIGDSRRQQRKLRRSNSDGNDIMSKAKSSILYNDMPAFDVSSHRPPLMHSQEPDASGNVQSKYRRSTNSTKLRSHSVSFTINPETNSGIWDNSEFNTTSNNGSLLESHQQVHQHAKYGRSYGSSYNGSVSLLAEPRYARKMHSYQQNGSVSFIKEPENNRSSSSADSFTEIENNIYTAFTRDASLKNAAMRNTFEKPRSASTRSRRNNSAPRNSRKVNAAQRSHDDIVSDGNFHVPRTSRKALAAQRSHDDTISEGNFHASRISRKPQRSHDDTVSEGNFHVSQVGQQREHCTTSEGNLNVSHRQKHQSHGRISDNQIEAGQGRQRRSHKTQSTVSENNFDTGSHVSTQSSQSSQKSCGTGASGHNLDTTVFTEPLHINDLDHSLDSDGGSVRSVQSAYTDIGRLNTTDSRLAHRSRHTKPGYSDVGSVITAYGTDIADTRGRHHYIRRSGAGTSSGSHYGPVQSSHPGQLKLSVYVNYGLLTIHIGQAKKLSSRFGTPCSSFVQVSLEPDLEDRTQCKTSMVGDSNTPVYDEKFSFELIEEDHHKRVYIAVYNIDFDSGVNECLGSMSFSIKRILAAPEKLRGWFHLLPESRGHKHCMPVKDKRAPSQHAPPQHEQTLPLPPISAALRPNQSMVWMDSHVLTIQRSRHGYGFVVSGSSPVQVSQVHTDSEAMRSGLHKDDYITHINGLNVANSSADNVARIISGIQGTICIEVERPRTMSSLNMTTVSHKPLNPPARTSHRKFAGFRIPFLPAKRESNKLNKTVTSATSHNTTLHQKLNKTLNLSFMSKSKRKSKSSNAVNKTMFECTEVVPSSDAASDISTVASSQLSSLNVSRSAEQLCGTMGGTMVNTTSVDTTINITTVDMTHSAANITTSMNKSFKRSLPWRKKKGIVKN